jgi:hypothetical protein
MMDGELSHRTEHSLNADVDDIIEKYLSISVHEAFEETGNNKSIRKLSDVTLIPDKPELRNNKIMAEANPGLNLPDSGESCSSNNIGISNILFK